MQSVIERKVKNIVLKLEPVSYINPFQSPEILELAKNKGVKIFDEKKSYQKCRPLGLYKNNICEIITPKTILTREHHEHLINVKNKWGLHPYLLYYDASKLIVKHFKYDINSIPDNKWISASKTRNYILDDPLIDYLKANNIESLTNTIIPRRCKRAYSETFNEQLMNNGNDFEASVIDHIEQIIDKNDFIKIGESYEASNISKYIETLIAIQRNIPVIYQPVLWNEQNKTFGCADLIVKSSFAKNIFPAYNNDDDVYEVYDIKCSTISMLSDAQTINNDKSAKVFKAQIWIYTQALKKMTGKTINYAYVIGKKYKQTKKDENGKSVTETHSNPFNEIAQIDFRKENQNIKKFKEGIKWLKEVRTNKSLCHDPPNDKRLYPNMKNHNDDFHDIKKELAKKNKEITLLYNVGVKHRFNAIDNNIKRLDDPKLTTDILGLKESPTTSLIKNIIEVNSTACEENIIYSDMSNMGNWKNAKVRCYLDIEAISSAVYNLDYCRPNFICMIGVGIVIDDKWTFKIFTADSLTSEGENKILVDFNNCMNKLSETYRRISHIPVFHWSNYESINLKPLLMINDKFEFNDMCYWVKDNKICVKGSYDFKLKNYTKALDANKEIDCKWPDSVSDGINAMNTAYNYYIHGVGDISVIKEVEKYNEIDCRAMFEIHQLCKTIEA